MSESNLTAVLNAQMSLKYEVMFKVFNQPFLLICKVKHNNTTVMKR